MNRIGNKTVALSLFRRPLQHVGVSACFLLIFIMSTLFPFSSAFSASAAFQSEVGSQVIEACLSHLDRGSQELQALASQDRQRSKTPELSASLQKIRQHSNLQRAHRLIVERLTIQVAKTFLCFSYALVEQRNAELSGGASHKTSHRPVGCSYYFLRLAILSSQAHPPTQLFS